MLKVGIIGLPNAGKSTLFNALLKKQQALAANYPFATIEPNIGVVPVPDSRLPILAKLVHTEVITPATVKFVDIAGLVKGASKGEGLGNKFLSYIREVDLICHVIRAFDDSDVVHIAGNVDSDRDKEIIDSELILADLQTIEKVQNSRLKTQNHNEKLKIKIIEKLRTNLDEGILAKDVKLTAKEKEAIRDLHLITMKRVLYVKNVSETDISSKLKVQNSKHNEIVISAKTESELASLSGDEQKEYLKDLGLESSGLERLIQKAYKMLGLISFLTGGEIEARAWTIAKGAKAVDAAGVIHTDFTKKFIKAEVVDFDTFVSCGGWAKARQQGKARLEGREYVVRDQDVIDFKIGA